MALFLRQSSGYADDRLVLPGLAVMTVSINSPLEPYMRKLEQRTPLPPAERTAFLALPASIETFGARDLISEEDSVAERCFIVVSGFLSRQKRVNGAPRIIGFGIPGDAVDLQSLWFHRLDNALVAHSPVTLVSVAHDHVIDLCRRCPVLAGTLWHDTLVDAAIFREWTVNVGHRRARLRVAHLLLEVATRLQAAGVTRNDTFEFPVTQTDLASALGLSLVHYNKSLASLRSEGFVETFGRVVTIRDRPALEAATGFDPTYLHLSAPPKFGPLTTVKDGATDPVESGQRFSASSA